MSLGPLTLKEVKSLVRDRTFLASLIIAPIILLGLGAAESHIINKAVKEEAVALLKMKTVVVVEENSTLVNNFIKSLNLAGGNVKVIWSTAVDPVDMLSKGYDVVLIVPKGFTANVTSGRPGELDLYVKVRSTGISLSAKTSGITSALRVAIDKALAETLGLPPNIFLSPLKVESYVFIPSIGTLSPREATSLMWLPLTVGMILLILAMVVAQISALSMSFEREEKTLEVLLSLPISRTSIVISKISGAFVASLIEVVVFTVSMIGYVRLIGSAGGVEISPALRILGRPQTLALLAVSMVIVLLFVSSIAMFLGMFGKDPRTSQSISTSVVAPLALIGYFVTLAGVPSGTSGYLIASIPVTPVVISLLASLQGNTLLALYSLAVNIMYTLLTVYVLMRVASGERLLIGYKLPRWHLVRARRL